MRKIITLLTVFAVVFSSCSLVFAENTELFDTNFKSGSGITLSSTSGSSAGTGNGLTLNAAADADVKEATATATFGDITWQDYTIDTTFRINETKNSDDRIIIIFKNKSKYNRYALIFSVQSGKMYVAKDSVTNFTVSSYTKEIYDVVLNKNKDNTLKITSQGEKLNVVVNGAEILDFTDLDPVYNGGISITAATKGTDVFTAKFSRMTVNGSVKEDKAISGVVVGNTNVFNDNFESDLSKWTTTGNVRISKDYGLKTARLGNGESKAAIESVADDYSDFQLDFYGKAGTDGYSVYTRYAGINIFYRFDFLSENGGTVRIVKRVNNDETVLASIADVKERFGLDLKEFNTIRIVCSNEHLGVFYGLLNDEVVTCSDANTGVLKGKLIFESRDAYFDDISVSTGGSIANVYAYDPIKPIDKANMNHNDETDNIYKEIYVSKAGNDENDGSKAKPFYSIERATKELEALTPNMTGNIVINVESGTYELKESIKITNATSGKNGWYVIYKSVGGRSTLTAGQKVKDKWEYYRDGIYKTSVKSLYETGFKEFYVNGERKVRAGEYEMNPEFLSWNDPETKYSVDGLYISKSLLPEVKHPEDLEWQSYTAWRTFHCPVETQEDSGRNDGYWLLKMQQPSFSHAYDLGPAGANIATHRSQRIRIENALEMLNEPGEWYYDTREDILYYYPEVYESLETAQCFIPGNDRLIEIFGESRENHAGNVTFSGFDFCHTGYEYMTKYGYVTNQTPFVKDMEPGSPTGQKEMDVQYAIKVQNADNIKFYDNKFSNLGSSAMHFVDAVNNVSITGNVFDDVADTGIVIGHRKAASMAISWDYITPPDNFYIANNIINDIGAEYPTGIGIITTYATNVWILHNEISNIGLNPLSLGWGWAYPATLNLHSHCTMYNVLRDYNYKQLVHDLAAVYMLSAQQSSIIAENYFVNDFGGSYGAIYYDQGASYVLSTNNVIKDVNASVFILSSERHDNLAINNWSTDTGVTNSGVDSYVVDLKKVDNYEWPSAAQKVIDNAGLEEKYEYLRDYRTNTSICLDNTYKLSGYKNNSSNMLRFGARMPISNTDDSIKAKIINGKLYLPKEEIEKVCFVKIPTFLGASMSYNKNDNTVVCAFSKATGNAPQILKAPVGSNEWNINGKTYITDSPVIVENDKAYISVEDVFECFGIGKTVVYSGDVAAICEKGFDFTFEGNENVAKYISDRLSK